MLITAFILGIAGSLHCAGMCSPLAFAVTSKGGSVLINRGLYNSGRILVYCILGMVVSAAGVMLPVTFQYVISIALGVVLLVIGITGSNFRAPILTPILRLTTFLKGQFSIFLQHKKYSSVFAMGILNGLLPCGLTFLALTSCITLSGPFDGFIFMAAFGAGTLPVMLGLISVIPLFAKRLNMSMGKLAAIMQIAAGCLLIVRVLLVDTHVHTVAHGVNQIIICR